MKRQLLALIVAAALLLVPCAAFAEAQIPYHCADLEEGIELLTGNTDYINGYTQNDLDFRVQKTGSTLDDWYALAESSVQEYTDEEKAVLDEAMAAIEKILADNGYTLPAIDQIIFVKTTQAEEGGSGAYTHDNEIYVNDHSTRNGASLGLQELICHELFHTLTRNNPEFREAMYSLIHFTVHDEDYVIGPSIMEYFVSNPDVGHHNASAVFTINGEPTECFMAIITNRHFDPTLEHDSFFRALETVLIPVDNTDTYYTIDQATDFWDVLGHNTGYVIDPEECLADNFAYALVYGMDGPDGEGYENPEIIAGMIDYLKK